MEQPFYMTPAQRSQALNSTLNALYQMAYTRERAANPSASEEDICRKAIERLLEMSQSDADLYERSLSMKRSLFPS